MDQWRWRNRYSQTSQERHQIHFVSFFNNLLASSIALQAIGSIRIDSFTIACAFLVGLFFYDIFWNFGTAVMMTVATKLETPIKFLFLPTLHQFAHRSYPYSVLGLGDIVIPGIMSALGGRLDVTGMAVESSDSSITEFYHFLYFSHTCNRCLIDLA